MYLDDDGILFALDYYNNTIFGSDANNLTTALSIKLYVSYVRNFAYNDEYFYIVLNNVLVMIMNKINRTFVSIINSSYTSSIYGIIFLQKGETMVCV